MFKKAYWCNELCFGAKYGTFLAAQKLPYLETLSCLQNWQPQSFQEWKLLKKSKISKIGNFQLNFARNGKNRKFPQN